MSAKFHHDRPNNDDIFVGGGAKVQKNGIFSLKIHFQQVNINKFKLVYSESGMFFYAISVGKNRSQKYLTVPKL